MTAWQTPTITVHATRRSEEARRLRDRQLARWCGLSADEVEPFLARLRIFDARTRAWEEHLALEEAVELAERRRAILRQVEGWGDTREGMLVRIDAVIADLDAQLARGRSERAA